MPSTLPNLPARLIVIKHFFQRKSEFIIQDFQNITKILLKILNMTSTLSSFVTIFFSQPGSGSQVGLGPTGR